MVHIVVTALGTFRGFTNPTMDLAKHLREDPHVHAVHVVQVAAAAVLETMEPLWHEAAENASETAVFLHLGDSDDAKSVVLEQCAYNVANFDLADERGWVCNNETILPGELDVLSTTLPLEKYVSLRRADGDPCNFFISTDPGRYICNYTYFHSLHRTKLHVNQHALFVHVPSFDVISETDQVQILRTLIATMHSTL